MIIIVVRLDTSFVVCVICSCKYIIYDGIIIYKKKSTITNS